MLDSKLQVRQQRQCILFWRAPAQWLIVDYWWSFNMFAFRYAPSIWEYDLWHYIITNYLAFYKYFSFFHLSNILVWHLGDSCLKQFLSESTCHVFYYIRVHFSTTWTPQVSCFLSEELMWWAAGLQWWENQGWQSPLSLWAHKTPLWCHFGNFCFFRCSIWFMLLINAEEVETQKHMLGANLALKVCNCKWEQMIVICWFQIAVSGP